MASQSQIQANRKNAHRSTGPRTPQGKAKVALNALSHGLTAVKVVAGVEDKDLFEALRAQLNREWRPGSVMEVILVDRIAELIWQLRRVGGVEVQVLERMPKWRPPGVAPEVFPLADAMAKDFAKPNPTLMRVQLYQSRLERAMLRAVRELKVLQIERQMQDEGEDWAEEETLPPPLTGERPGEGMPRKTATSEPAAAGAAADGLKRLDARRRCETSSPHLASPQGEGPEGKGFVVGAGESEKTKPIVAATDGPAGGWAAGPVLLTPAADAAAGRDRACMIPMSNVDERPGEYSHFHHPNSDLGGTILHR